MLDFNLISAIGVIAALVLLVRFGFPFLKEKGMKSSMYNDVKMGLLLFGYAFRDDKIKTLTMAVYDIVSSLEQLDIAAEDKKAEALQVAFTELMDNLNIALDEEALGLIIDIAVSYLPPTHPRE